LSDYNKNLKEYKTNYANIDWSAKIDKPKKVIEYIPEARSHLSAPRILSDYEAYECPVSGKSIEGRRAHEENLKATGCRVLESGEKEDNARNAQIAAQAEDKRRDKAIDSIVDTVANEYFK
jgi:hypothetical protein